MIRLEYLRKSRDRREREDPDVLRRHRTILLELARQDGVTIPSEHIFEEVRSGESIAARPEFRRLLAMIDQLTDCPGDRAQAVLYCIEADRLARGILTERGEVQELLIRKGVVIRETVGLTDLRNPDQRLLHNVKGALAEWELGKYKERVARTRALQVRQGQVRNGSVPFGYLWDHAARQPRPDPARFPILQAMCRSAISFSTHQLADQYGIPQPVILRALRSPMICGWPAKTVETRRLENGTMVCRYLPRDRWVWPDEPGSYEPAIDRASWERLQVILDGRRKGKAGRQGSSSAWCRDLVRLNGQRARLGTYHGWGGKREVYETAGDRKGPYRRLFVDRAVIHRAVLEVIRPLLESEHFLLALSVRPAASSATDEAALKHEVAAIHGRRQWLLLEESKADPREVPDLRAARQSLLAREEQISDQLARIRSRVPALSEEEAQHWSGVAAELRGRFEMTWDQFGDDEKRRLVGWLIEAVEVTVTALPGRHERRVEVKPAPWWSSTVVK